MTPYKRKFQENDAITNRRFKVSKTYNIVTPESARNGDYADSGFEYKNQVMSLDELRDEIRHGGFTQNNGHYLSTSDPDIEYNTGEEKSYSLHIADMSGKDLDSESYNKIMRMVGIK